MSSINFKFLVSNSRHLNQNHYLKVLQWGKSSFSNLNSDHAMGLSLTLLDVHVVIRPVDNHSANSLHPHQFVGPLPI